MNFVIEEKKVTAERESGSPGLNSARPIPAEQLPRADFLALMSALGQIIL